jgi:hypothetical protein
MTVSISKPVTPALLVHHGALVGQLQHLQAVDPEGVVPVAEVGVPGPEEGVRHGVQHPVAPRPYAGDVGAATGAREACALGEVRPVLQRLDEELDLAGVGRAVRVEHHDDVTGDRGETARHRVALATPRLRDHDNVGSQRTGHSHGAVRRTTVHEDDLVQSCGQLREHVREVRGLVVGRDHHAHARGGGPPADGQAIDVDVRLRGHGCSFWRWWGLGSDTEGTYEAVENTQATSGAQAATGPAQHGLPSQARGL